MSIKINVSLFSHQYTDGQQVVEVNGNTVSQCLDDLIKQFPRIREPLFDQNGKLNDYTGIYVNGESTYPEGLAKPVKDGDKLDIIPIISGG